MRPSNCKVHLLDVGASQYGDCLVVEYEGETILIDGGHRGDLNGSPGHRSIPTQLDAIFGSDVRPHRFSLVVISHAHADHIGCLPELFATDVIATEWALLTDPDLAWSAEESVAADNAFAGLFAALREEPRLDIATADDLRIFEADAVALQGRYRQMIQALTTHGVNVVRHGRDPLKPLHDRFKDIDLHVIGPSKDHLRECAHLLGVLSRDFHSHARTDASADHLAYDLAVYQKLARFWEDIGHDHAVEDGLRFGDVVNMQSIVFRLGRPGRRFLLSGDSQLEKPKVSGDVGRTNVQYMLQKIRKAAPFDFMKVGHHGSENAFGETLLTAVGQATTHFGICTGSGGGHHPSTATLERLDERTGAKWARTDRNGLITFDFADEQVHLDVERGAPNDPSPPGRGAPTDPASAATPLTRPVPTAPSPAHSPPAITSTVDMPGGYPPVEIRVPYVPGATVQISITFSGPAAPTVQTGVPFRLAAGRALPPLLMVTHTSRLRVNLGAAIVDTVLAELQRAGMVVVDLALSTSGSSQQARQTVQAACEAHPEVVGVVLLGGYDVVPSVVVDTLGKGADPARRGQDREHFVVWSDWSYGDTDGDGLADLPVSRVPDGSSPELFLAALGCGAHACTERHGIRNAARPFADGIFAKLPGTAPMLASHPYVRSPATGMPQADAVYFMLHGHYESPDRYTGEDEAFGNLDAFHADDLRLKPGAVVFTGCCWGGLTVKEPAYRNPQQPLPLTVEQSVPLRALAQGASAFIGCTGIHYSPVGKPYDRFGPLLHTGFWDNMIAGMPPAKAMWNARRTFSAGIHSRHPDSGSRAGADIERKMYEQYTVLGLGW